MRRVRTVHLTAPNDALLRRGALLLEDALHTASLPEADGGWLWLVRSLSVGRINPKGSSASLALHIEQQVRQWGLLAFHGSDPAAETAAVVYFRSALEAHIVLAQRLSRSQPTNAWFWSLAVPGWQPQQTLDVALRQILYDAFSLPGGVVAVAELLGVLVQERTGDRLLASLTPQDGRQLLQACGWQASPTLNPERFPPLDLPLAWRLTLAEWLSTWGPADERVLWLGAIALIAQNPSRLAAATVLVQAQGLIQQLSPNSNRSSVPEPESLKPPLPAAEHGLTPSPSADLHLSPLQPADSVLPADPEVRLPPEVPGSLPDSDSETETVAPWFGLPTVKTAFAGFYFLVPLLSQLHIEVLLQHHPHLLELDWPRRLLLRTADQLGIPTEDPVLLALSSPAPLAAPEQAIVKSLCRIWSKTLQCWSRRDSHLSLARLVRRPGALVYSRTHIDLYFDHRQADIRVRRLGLDLDPGWVPWLGHVLQFHYSKLLGF
jgi:hypothetical protein